jgi:AraC-like DNA-binding protein
LPNATRRSFWLNGSAWDFPDFENAETFVKRLVRAGLIAADRTVEGAVRGELQNVTTRTEQRHVLQVTGLTLGAICQIERARRATLLLKRETPILDVVHEAGYYDQAHLTRSLQRFMGQTPARAGVVRYGVIVTMNQDTIMHTPVRHSSAFKAMPRLGTGLTGLVVLFLAFDGFAKVIRVAPVVEACQKAGIASDLVTGIGLLLLACTAIYMIPKTTILGAILLTGYLLRHY